MAASLSGKYSVMFTEVTHCGDGSSQNCDITIKENKNGSCYKLDYKWTVVSGNTNYLDNAAYPLDVLDKYGDETFDGTGVIVAKNDMTIQMIRHLVMTDEDLQMVCGLGTSADYRAKIIRALATIWD